MKRSFLALSLATVVFGFADNSFVDPRDVPIKGEYPDNPFYGIVGTGYAWTMDPGIDNPNPADWDPSLQGYDNSFGGSPFLMIGLGREYFDLLHIDLSYTYYQTFHYQKYQTGVASTPGFTGSERMRFFDLDHQNILFDVSVYPWSLQVLNVKVTPFAGAAIGVGFNQVTNFHTVGYDSSAGVGSTTSIGTTGVRAVFAWQVSAGVRIKPDLQHLSFDFGYHYYNGGSFTGPSNVMVNASPFNGGISSGNAPWTGTLKANEFYFTLNLAY